MTDYIKRNLFSTPIFEFNNKNLAIKIKEYIMLKEINGIESNVTKELKHNLDESEFDFFAGNDEVISEIRSYIASCLKSVINDLSNTKDNYKISFTESWYHIGRKNSSHDIHNHPNCSWCGVFYIQSGDKDCGGETSFRSPIDLQYRDFGTIHSNYSLLSVTPEDGKLIIFPSYLYHFQSLYKGNEDRITVAFNSQILAIL